jgi:hypothetical protein
MATYLVSVPEHPRKSETYSAKGFRAMNWRSGPSKQAKFVTLGQSGGFNGSFVIRMFDTSYSTLELPFAL